MTQPAWNESLDRPTWLWWVWLPLTLRRFSPGAALSLLDGYYLVAWPRASALLPPCVFAAGLVVGWAQPGFETAFTESLLLIMLAAILGVFSANLGGLFLAGFALGNFLFTDPRPEYLRESREGLLLFLPAKAAQLIQYGLLSWLVVNVAQLSRSLLATIRPPESLSRQAQLIMLMCGQAILTALIVYFWVQSLPVLIRPLFTWVRGSPTVAAVAPLQNYGWLVVCTAAAAAAVRVRLQAKSASEPALAERVDLWDEQLVLAPPVRSITEGLNPWVGISVQAAWSTLLLAGMMTDLLDALLLGGVLLALRAAQTGAITIPLGSWPQLVTRVPALARLAAGLLLISYLAGRVMESQRFNSGFRPILLLTCLSLVLLYLLNPYLPEQDRTGGP